MSLLAHDDAGTAMPVLAVVVGIVFIVVCFFKFLDWATPSAEGLGSGEVGKVTSTSR